LSRTIEPGVYENDLNRLGNDFALALNRELEGLAAAGAPFALLEEPLFMGESSEIDAFLNMIETAGKGLDLNLYISLDNLNREAIPAILEAPCAGLAFSRDIMAEEYRPILLKPASDGKIIEIGIISPRKPQTEDPDAMAAQLVSWSQSYPPELTWLSPASGLGGLTRESAYVKLENLVRIANLARKLIGEE
jgi:methionine synthase II (cobalamin-independent)